MTTHCMGLNPGPFAMIQSGEKTIELRLYDEKRRKIRVGDRIVFTNTENEAETLETEVLELFVFPSFRELYAALPLLECGYTPEDVDRAAPEDMNAYYSEERQKQYGVVGIRLRAKP